MTVLDIAKLKADNSLKKQTKNNKIIGVKI